MNEMIMMKGAPSFCLHPSFNVVIYYDNIEFWVKVKRRM
jgi:hypothetical protein